MRVIMLGDSITAGMTEGGYATDTLAKIIARETGDEVTNAGISMTQVYAGKNPFVEVVNHYDFANYDLAMIMYGTNDFGWQQETLNSFKDKYHEGIDKIKNDNPDIEVRLMTPIQDFDNNIDHGSGNMNWKNREGLSLNDFCDAVLQVGKDYGFKVYDWRDNPIVTNENHKSALSSDGIHPLQQTYEEMGAALASWLIETSSKVDWSEKYVDIPDTIRLISIYKNRLYMIYAKIRALYKMDADYFDDDEVPSFEVAKLATNEVLLNRTVYLWTIKVMLNLQQDVNQIVKAFNEDSFIDPETGKETNELKLWIPRRLTLDETYREKLNHNFKSVNALLDRLYLYLKKNID